MSIRKIFFWLHLTVGSLAGLVIFIMCVTGVCLAFERQILLWADRGFQHAPPTAGAIHVPVDTLLANARDSRQTEPTGIILRSDPNMPAAVEFGRNNVVYLNPYTGAVLGEGSQSARAFFGNVEGWHRNLAGAGISPERLATGRLVTGVANLLFLFLVSSGIYLWWPRKWSWRHVRPVVWFRRDVQGRARNWNWHNTIGFWCAIPLFCIVLCGVVMSFPWANNLVYRMTGNEAPPANGRGAGNGGGIRKSAAAQLPLNPLWERAEKQVPNWRIITIRQFAASRAPVSFTIDQGDGGRPDLRGTLTLNRKTAEVIKWEPFSSSNSGRQLRSWIRFTHTGEAGGLVGETIAAIAAAGGVLMVWTGLTMAIRRLINRFSRVSSSAKIAA